MLVAEFLHGERHEPQCVSDGLAGFAAIERDPPDLVVTDLMMPRLEGVGLVARPREGGYRIPVVVITA